MKRIISRINKNRINKLFIGGKPKKVLVLCQRKTGLSNGLIKYNVEEIVIPKINELVQGLIGDVHTITYMTDMRGYEGTVDINCKLDGVSECSKSFISENANSFDLILLQTCPYSMMEYNILHTLLKPTGIIGITALPNEIKGDLFSSEHIALLISHIPPHLFKVENTDNLNIIIFTKIPNDGGNYKKKSKKNKISKISKIKTGTSKSCKK